MLEGFITTFDCGFDLLLNNPIFVKLIPKDIFNWHSGTDSGTAGVIIERVFRREGLRTN